MKKKTIVIFLLFVLASTSVFAAFLQIGPTATYDVPVDLEAETPVDFESIDLEKFTVGGDMRINAWFLQLQGEARGSFDKELRLNQVDLYAAANLRFNLILADITIGGGIKTEGNCLDGKWTFNGKQPESFEPILMSSQLFYRGGFSLNFGRISLTAEAIAPLNLTVDGLFEEKNQSVIGSLTPDFSRTQVSVGVLLNFFR